MQARIVVEDGLYRGIGESFAYWPDISGLVTNIGTIRLLNKPTCYPYEYEFRVENPQGPLLAAIQTRE